MNAETLKTAMQFADKLGRVTKVNAFDNIIYIDGETEDNETFHLTLQFEEKEKDNDSL
jgi:hypothetical protein